MDSPLITVPMPTVTGREEYLQKAIASYEATANVELIVFTDFPGCGAAWVKGAEQAQGDYIHFGADDVEMHPGWWQSPRRFCDLGYLPAARIVNTDGSLQSCGEWGVEHPDGEVTEFTRSPFVSRAQWEALAPLVVPFLETAHYYTDNIISWAGRRLGMETVVCRRYEYTHHLAEVKRGAGSTWEGKMREDYTKFINYIRSFD